MTRLREIRNQENANLDIVAKQQVRIVGNVKQSSIIQNQDIGRDNELDSEIYKVINRSPISHTLGESCGTKGITTFLQITVLEYLRTACLIVDCRI
jgi:hypothetical protein